MYLSLEAITEAIKKIQAIHPFFGIDFLAAKKAGLPVGDTIEVRLDSLTRSYMTQYFKPFEFSSFYYGYYENKWLPAKYPGSTSQTRRTRGRWSEPFIHNTDLPRIWGWKSDYLDILQRELIDRELKGNKVPVFHLAVWLYRDKDWFEDTTRDDIIFTFMNEFYITSDEASVLLDISTSTQLSDESLFDSQPVMISSLIPLIGIPSDLPPEGGAILSYLELHGVGPAEKLTFEPGKRINLLTGDNGLGKTFLLDTSWWALTGHWIDYPADPTNRNSKQANITYKVSGEYTESKLITVNYDRASLAWQGNSDNQALPSLLVYAKADNSFAVWDPAQHYQSNTISRPFIFSPQEVWLGLEESTTRRSICEGLLRDWVTWQNTENTVFNTFVQVLKHLSPEDTGQLKPGQPTRIPNEKRLIPTLEMPYGDVAVIYASEGMRRILALAYLLVWAWSEHQAHAKLAQIEPQRRMVILIDEIEAHLHPKWQRLILPALIDVQHELSQELEVQFLIATHSPLVMASVEPIFNSSLDKLFNLELTGKDLFKQQVVLKELPFVRFGVVDAWLTSDVFELAQPRSVEAEKALEAAKRIQLEDEPRVETIQEIHVRLVKLLAADDEFWPRWLFFAESYGVQV